MIKKNGFYALIFFYNIQKRNAFYGKKSFKMLQHPYSFCELNFITFVLCHICHFDDLFSVLEKALKKYVSNFSSNTII